MLQVLSEKRPRLAETLRVRVHAAEVRQVREGDVLGLVSLLTSWCRRGRRQAAKQEVVHVEIDLVADDYVGELAGAVGQGVEGEGDGAVGGVFEGHYAEGGRAGLHAVKDFCGGVLGLGLETGGSGDGGWVPLMVTVGSSCHLESGKAFLVAWLIGSDSSSCLYSFIHISLSPQGQE